MPRDFSHDYRSESIYHLTFSKAADAPAFSVISGSLAAPVVAKTPVGKVIEDNLWNLNKLCTDLRLLQYAIMPDHIHILVYATRYLERPLGAYVGMLKVKITQQIGRSVFNDDFYDRILRRSHSLDTIYNYIRSNPYRLLVRRLHPEYFSRVNSIEIDSARWSAYGNMLLLKNPFKEQVIVHRKDTEADFNSKRNRWLHVGANGGVLISPFISPKEKAIRAEAEAMGGKTILLVNKSFGDKFKPSGNNFSLCERGQLLIIAPETDLEPGRETFLYLNKIAALLAARG